MKRISYLFCVFTIIAGSDIAATNTAFNDLLKTTGKIVAGGMIGGAASIVLKKSSPDTSLAGIGATLLGATLLATRATTMVDINKMGHDGRVPGFGLVMSEANWFNVLAIAIAATEYGLHQHGHKLTKLLQSLAGTLKT